MKKSKKSLKNKNPTATFIYGSIAVGKLTIAKILAKKLGYKLIHNHALNDLIDEIFDYGTDASSIMKENLRPQLLEGAVKANINFITTQTYSHNYISPTGITDPKYVQALEKKLTKLDVIFYPVHLKADKKELLRRVNMSSRKAFKKLVSKKIMRRHLINKDWKNSPRLKNNLIIDNTKLSPKKVSDMIIKHFKLK